MPYALSKLEYAGEGLINTTEPEPQLSVVVVSRNDNHGGDMLGRMQHFVDGFFAQCRRHDLSAELIMVEWNPPGDRPPLAEALTWPEDMGTSYVRIVTVPHDVHAQLTHSEALPLFQMIGKNVGIRRARGRYVLATNIDILMNDALIRYMRDCLIPNMIVRVDRFDVPENVPHDPDFDKVIEFCDANVIRIATRHGIFLPKSRCFVGFENDPIMKRLAYKYAREIWPSNREGRHAKPRRRVVRRAISSIARAVGDLIGRIPWFLTKLWPPQRIPARVCRLRYRGQWPGRKLWRRTFHLLDHYMDEGVLARLHTHACGDFTLLARKDWARLRGYPEWPMYSWHIDSLFMCLAAGSGMHEIALPPQYRSYHIEHDAGSGWTPEAEEKLFSRLRAKGIAYLTFEDLKEWGRRCTRNDAAACVINGENWGFGDIDLPEVVIGGPSTGRIVPALAAAGVADGSGR